MRGSLPLWLFVLLLVQSAVLPPLAWYWGWRKGRLDAAAEMAEWGWRESMRVAREMADPTSSYIRFRRVRKHHDPNPLGRRF